VLAEIMYVLHDIRDLMQNPPEKLSGQFARSIPNTVVEFSPQPEKDPLFDEAVKWLKQDELRGIIFTPRHLMTRFQLPYYRAASLTDQLEAAGIVSVKNGVKPRKVL
jgi:DNA segregation ATPase FtsK/SpoIIIE-like protein